MLVHERFTVSLLAFHYSCDLDSMLSFLPNSWFSIDGHLNPDTDTIVFPITISTSHWVTISVGFDGGTLQATVYKSMSSMGNQSSINQNLPQIIDTIIAANPDATSWTEARSGQRKVIKPRTLPQTNSDDCGIFAV